MNDELKAAYERIDELKASLAEMLSIYWGNGDGQEPLPVCIQRAEAALADEVLSWGWTAERAVETPIDLQRCTQDYREAVR